MLINLYYCLLMDAYSRFDSKMVPEVNIIRQFVKKVSALHSQAVSNKVRYMDLDKQKTKLFRESIYNFCIVNYRIYLIKQFQNFLEGLESPVRHLENGRMGEMGNLFTRIFMYIFILKENAPYYNTP